jgi:hypothetical protein
MAVDSSWAQQTTGSLEGRILDEGGEPVAYANIVVSGPNLQGARGTISTTDGYFRIPSLPIGVYIVNISHITYQALTYHDIAIQLGKTTSLPETRLSVRVHEAPEVGNQCGFNELPIQSPRRSADRSKLPLLHRLGSTGQCQFLWR